MNLFKRRPKQGQILDYNPPVDPAAMEQPTDTAAYLRRGYAYYGVKQYAEAVEDFKKALELDPNAVDAVYGQGMSLKASGKKEEAIAAFKNALALIDQGVIPDKSRARILHRLALGHVNEITSGNWNLEAEIWQHIA
jgi:tetratricopeptide (TPR) repeat protein